MKAESIKKCVFLFTLVLFLSSCVSQSRYNRDIEELEGKISRLEEVNDYLVDIIKRARREVDDADDYLLMNEYFLASLSISDALLILDGRK